MSLRGPLNALKKHLREALEEHHIRLINIRNHNSFADTTCYEFYYETNFNDWQIDKIVNELARLCPSVDFEWDLDSYEVQTVTKVVRRQVGKKFRHRIILMATQLKVVTEL